MDVVYRTNACGSGPCSVSSENVSVFRLKTRRLDVAPHTFAEAFSIKTVFSGLERYQFEEREVGVAPGEVLMVPPGLTYGSSIRSSEPTDCFSVYFPNRWIEAHLNRVAMPRLAGVA